MNIFVYVRRAMEAVGGIITTHKDLIPLALGASLVLAAMAVSFWSLMRSAAWNRAAARNTKVGDQRIQAELAGLRDTVSTLAADLEATRVAAASGYTTARPGMNLSKRSQVLRLHRRGESSDQIATSLDVPRQEVELLLKVHRIVMARVQ